MAEDLVKVTLNLNRVDYDRITQLHPATPRAVIIRMVIQAYIAATESGGLMILDQVKSKP